MKHILFFILTISLAANAQISFDDYFEAKTLRIDVFHTGTAKDEIFSLDQVYEEGEWSGTRTHMVSPVDAGLYRATVRDAASGKKIFAIGYNSIFGEWQTTGEAINGIYRTMHESIRIPYPLQSIRLVISKRDRQNRLQELWSTEIDPASRFVNREKKIYPFTVRKLVDNGAPAVKVDLLIMGDGYTKNEMSKFHRDVERYTKDLFSAAPFNKRQSDFNVWTIDVVSEESGIDEPRKNKWRRSALGASFNTFDLSRYVLSLHNKEIRDIASLAPYDAVIILFNQARYGGGGIYNCMATCYTGTPEGEPDWWSDYVFVHEFGHAFAGLADEYYSSNVAYNDMYPVNVEPWEPNITTLHAGGKAKWARQITPGVPVPTPWSKAKYDSLAKARAALDKNEADYRVKRDKIDARMKEILNNPDLQNVIGCFEGAGYASKGVYRPAVNCRMFSKSLVEFCPVCQSALENMIDYYVK